MAGGSFRRRGESSECPYPPALMCHPPPSHSSSRSHTLIIRAFPATASLCCFNFATTTAPWKERGRRKRARKRNKKRERRFGPGSQLDGGIWKDLTFHQQDERARNKGCVTCLLRWWHNSHKESTSLTPPQNQEPPSNTELLILAPVLSFVKYA